MLAKFKEFHLETNVGQYDKVETGNYIKNTLDSLMELAPPRFQPATFSLQKKILDEVPHFQQVILGFKDLIVQSTQESAIESQGSATQSSQIDKFDNEKIDYEDAFCARADCNSCPVLFEGVDGTVMTCEHNQSNYTNMMYHINVHFEKAPTKEEIAEMKLKPNFNGNWIRYKCPYCTYAASKTGLKSHMEKGHPCVIPDRAAFIALNPYFSWRSEKIDDLNKQSRYWPEFTKRLDFIMQNGNKDDPMFGRQDVSNKDTKTAEKTYRKKKKEANQKRENELEELGNIRQSRLDHDL